MTQRGFTESDSSSKMYTTGGLGTRVTESRPQAQQGFAKSTLDTYVLYNTQAQRMATESDSLSHSPRTQRRRWLSLALDTQLSDSASAKKVAESCS